jgi:two-component system cell cycle sensor histidine kinase/response regulator CckA
MTAETDHDLTREPVAAHEPSPRSGSIALVLLVAAGLVAVAVGLMTLGPPASSASSIAISTIP